MSIPLKKKERFPYACTTYNKIKSNSLILSNIQCIETSPSCPRRTGFTALWTSVLDGAWGPLGRVVPAFPPSLLWLWQKPCWRGPSREVFRLAADICPRCFSLGFPLLEEKSWQDSPPGFRWSVVIPWDCSRFVLLTPTWLSGWFPFHAFPAAVVFTAGVSSISEQASPKDYRSSPGLRSTVLSVNHSSSELPRGLGFFIC